MEPLGVQDERSSHQKQRTVLNSVYHTTQKARCRNFVRGHVAAVKRGVNCCSRGHRIGFTRNFGGIKRLNGHDVSLNTTDRTLCRRSCNVGHLSKWLQTLRPVYSAQDVCRPQLVRDVTCSVESTGYFFRTRPEVRVSFTLRRRRTFALISSDLW